MAINCALLRKQFKKEKEYGAENAFFACFAILIFILAILYGGIAQASTGVNMAIISQIESSNNPNAYNKASGAVGLCQITKIVLVEFNARFKRNYDMNDLYIDQINLMVADYYMNTRIPQMLKAYKIPDTLKNRLWAYNAGIGMVKRRVLPKETRNYFLKYERLNKGA